MVGFCLWDWSSSQHALHKYIIMQWDLRDGSGIVPGIHQSLQQIHSTTKSKEYNPR